MAILLSDDLFSGLHIRQRSQDILAIAVPMCRHEWRVLLIGGERQCRDNIVVTRAGIAYMQTRHLLILSKGADSPSVFC